MPVDTPHPEYNAYAPQWQTVRDAVAGEDRIKAAGTAYLPKLGGQEQDEYNSYVKRALYFEATARTLDGLTGMLFRKEPQKDVPGAIEPYLDDMDMAGRSALAMAESAAQNVLQVSRHAILVDYPQGVDATTQAEAERAGVRPYAVEYAAEDILNWRTERTGGIQKLTLVVLHETVHEVAEDGFGVNLVTQYRSLSLEEGQYVQRVWRKDQDKTEWVVVDELRPMMNGAPLDYIPFVFINPTGTTPDLEQPHLLPLANLNISHYRTMADLEHGAHFTALPTPYATGVSDKEMPEAIGPTAQWIFSSSDASVGLLEYTGQGLEALEKRAQSKESQMAVLGARMLAPEKKQVEAAETAAIHRSGENSVLASISRSVSEAMGRVLRIMADWSGQSGEVQYELTTDFTPGNIEPQTLTALLQALQAGQISQRSFLYNLQAAELLPPDKDLDSEISETESGALGGMNG